jgi:tRNA(Met) C34 N-acetyltransferase TmcA
MFKLMDIIDKDSKIEILEREITSLKLQLQETQERLKKYTFPDATKRYKERNKEKLNEYAKQYYQKKKLKDENN